MNTEKALRDLDYLLEGRTSVFQKISFGLDHRWEPNVMVWGALASNMALLCPAHSVTHSVFHLTVPSFLYCLSIY